MQKVVSLTGTTVCTLILRAILCVILLAKQVDGVTQWGGYKFVGRNPTGDVYTTTPLNDDGPATSASLSHPSDVFCRDHICHIADTDHHRIREVDMTTHIIRTVVGTGTEGYSGDEEEATNAQISRPVSVWSDTDGNVYLSDSGNYRIRMMDKDNIIFTVGGTGIAAWDADHGKSTSTNIDPVGLHGDSDNGIHFFADALNNRIRRVIATGHISTVAGNGITGYSGDGGPATAAALNHPMDIYSHPVHGDLYIADTYNQVIRFVSNGIISTLVGTGIAGYSGNLNSATSAQLNNPEGLHVLEDESYMFISDTLNHVVRAVDLRTFIITTLLGNPTVPGVGTHGETLDMYGLNQPKGIFANDSALAVVCDFSNNRTDYMIDQSPTSAPSAMPSDPSTSPTYAPTRVPSALPTVTPTVGPTAVPTETPTYIPSVAPSLLPSEEPSFVPSVLPTSLPTSRPTNIPTLRPTSIPTSIPSSTPTSVPSAVPSGVPSDKPTSTPTSVPTSSPTARPSAQPTAPTSRPSAQPNTAPSLQPSSSPTCEPSSQPSSQPSSYPSIPTSFPSAVPTVHTQKPSCRPTRLPTKKPQGSSSTSGVAAAMSDTSSWEFITVIIVCSLIVIAIVLALIFGNKGGKSSAALVKERSNNKLDTRGGRSRRPSSSVNIAAIDYEAAAGAAVANVRNAELVSAATAPAPPSACLTSTYVKVPTAPEEYAMKI